MAKKALKNKQQRQPKFRVRAYTRCQRCGRSRAVYKRFLLCRICFRELAHAGELPGVTKGIMVTKERRFSSNVTDPVADLLTRIRNANLAYKDHLAVPVSKVNESVLGILDAEGYIDGFEREGEGVHRAFRVRLKYDKKRQRTISGIKRVSTPGRRVYTGRDKLPRVLGGLGIAIVSTSQGVMTDKDASRKGIGGEVLAYVW